jgi:hypothetical protein
MSGVATPAYFPIPFANSGPKNTIPTASQSSVPPGNLASLTDGFPAVCMSPVAAGGQAPQGQDMNGILYQITANIAAMNAGVYSAYSAAESTAIGGYPLGAFLANATGTGFWLNLTANNTSNPDAAGAGWVAIGGQGQTAAESAVGAVVKNPAMPVGNCLRYGADPTGAGDSATALQASINVAQCNSYGAGVEAYWPGGLYKCGTTLSFTSQFIRLRGAGTGATSINATMSGTPVFQVATSVTNWNPVISDFSVSSTTCTYCFDLSLLTGANQQCYAFSFSNLLTITPAAAIIAYNLFSGVFQNWYARATLDHTFKVACGPGVSWISCYASYCGTGKAGYRLIGQVRMFACNGIDSGDYWGIFGQLWSGSTGYQHDFPYFSGQTNPNDYPDVKCVGCNAEAFAQASTTASAIQLEAAYRFFSWDGGVFDHSNSATQYAALVNTVQGPYWPGGVIRLAASIVKLFNVSFTGAVAAATSGTLTTGLASGTYAFEFYNGSGAIVGTRTVTVTYVAGASTCVWTGAITAVASCNLLPNAATGGGNNGGARCFSSANNAVFQDDTGTMGQYYYQNSAPAGYIPYARLGATQDISDFAAIQANALSTGRVTIGTKHYTIGSPTVTSNNIDVTGYDRVAVASGTVTTATFTSTQGTAADPSAPTDYGRNGDLIIECAAGVVITHTVGHTANTFFLTGGASITAYAGQILRFIRSVTNGNWCQA